MKNTVPVPLALRTLIQHSNELLRIYQQELTDKVSLANDEMMTILGLDSNDGWKLDTNTFTYVKIEKQSDDTSIS